MADNRPIPRTISEDQLKSLLDLAAKGSEYSLISRLTGLTPSQVRYAVTSPQFQAALKARVGAELVTDASMARRYLRRVLVDPKQSTVNRLQAGRLLLDRGGFVPPKASEQVRNPTNPAEMTSDQLRRQVEEIERELSQRAEPIEADTTQLTDMLD